jgi:hypothetical protein
MNPLLTAFILARALDLGTTQIALAHGAQEANPLLPSRPVPNLMAGAGLTVTQVAIYRALQEKHPRLGKVVFIGAIALEGYVSARNVRITR